MSDILSTEQTIGQSRQMAQKEFAGDPQHRLPKGKVEPYRLWFEYLKVALRHPEFKVDAYIFQDWHVSSDMEFDKWWSEHLRQLFAMRAETAVIDHETVG